MAASCYLECRGRLLPLSSTFLQHATEDKDSLIAQALQARSVGSSRSPAQVIAVDADPQLIALAVQLLSQPLELAAAQLANPAFLTDSSGLTPQQLLQKLYLLSALLRLRPLRDLIENEMLRQLQAAQEDAAAAEEAERVAAAEEAAAAEAALYERDNLAHSGAVKGLSRQLYLSRSYAQLYQPAMSQQQLRATLQLGLEHERGGMSSGSGGGSGSVAGGDGAATSDLASAVSAGDAASDAAASAPAPAALRTPASASLPGSRQGSVAGSRRESVASTSGAITAAAAAADAGEAKADARTAVAGPPPSASGLTSLRSPSSRQDWADSSFSSATASRPAPGSPQAVLEMRRSLAASTSLPDPFGFTGASASTLLASVGMFPREAGEASSSSIRSSKHGHSAAAAEEQAALVAAADGEAGAAGAAFVRPLDAPPSPSPLSAIRAAAANSMSLLGGESCS